MSRLKTLTLELDACRARNQELAEANAKADESISKVLKGVNDLVKWVNFIEQNNSMVCSRDFKISVIMWLFASFGTKLS